MRVSLSSHAILLPGFIRFLLCFFFAPVVAADDPSAAAAP
jgi:hypothetical protein